MRFPLRLKSTFRRARCRRLCLLASARAHDKVLRVARTIADLDGSAEVQPEPVSEAVNYRMLDRQFWS